MADQENKPVETTSEEAAGGEEEAGAQEAWVLPGVYRTAEDAVKAAEEGKRKISEQGQRLSALEGELNQHRTYIDQLEQRPGKEAEEALGEDDFVTAKSLKKMLQEELGRALEPLARSVGRTSLATIKREIADDPDYPSIKDEFEQYVGLLPPQALSDPEAIRLAYHAVKGQQADKVFQARQSRQTAPKLPGETVLGRVAGRTGAPVETQTLPLSAEQKRAAALLGIESEAELAQWADPNYFGQPPKEAK